MLENMRLLGKGNIAEVFEYGNEKVCKLFFEGYPDEYAALEFQNAREMYKNKIRISKPFQMITIENRKGIIYERIEGRTLLNIIMENEFGYAFKYTCKLADQYSFASYQKCFIIQRIFNCYFKKQKNKQSSDS